MIEIGKDVFEFLMTALNNLYRKEKTYRRAIQAHLENQVTRMEFIVEREESGEFFLLGFISLDLALVALPEKREETLHALRDDLLSRFAWHTLMNPLPPVAVEWQWECPYSPFLFRTQYHRSRYYRGKWKLAITAEPLPEIL